jgi:hypothetical protein
LTGRYANRIDEGENTVDEKNEPGVTERASRVLLAEQNLNPAEVVDYRRRKDTVGAIILFARSLFPRLQEIKSGLSAKRGSKKPIVWVSAAVGIGAVLHYFIKNPSSSWEFTLGTFVILIATWFYGSYLFDIYIMERDFNEVRNRCDELRYRWVANGGWEDSFWKLRDMAIRDPDGFGETAEYREWWYGMAGELIWSLTGKRVLSI